MPLRYIVTTVLAAIFGTHALALGKMVNGVVTWVTGGGRNPVYDLELGLITLGVGFFLLMALNARSAYLQVSEGRGQEAQESTKELVSFVVVAIIGAFFSIIEETEPGVMMWRSLLILAVVLFIAVPPVIALAESRNDVTRVSRIYVRIPIAFFIAVVISGLVQLSVQTGLFNSIESSAGVADASLNRFTFDNASKFFVSSPMVSGLTAALAVVAAEPHLTQREWSRFTRRVKNYWTLIFLVGAVVLSLVYSAGIYAPEHLAPSHGWVRQAGFEENWLILSMFALQLPGYFVGVGTVLIRPPKGDTRLVATDDVLSAASALVIGCGAASLVAVSLIDSAGMTVSKAIVFVGGHGVAAAGLVVGVRTAFRLQLK